MRLAQWLLAVFVLVLAAFVALNWDALMQPTELFLGWRTLEAPLGLVMLGFMALLLLGVGAASSARERLVLRERDEHNRLLQAQRELADKAEASRFTDLRTQIELHMRDLREHDVRGLATLEKGLMESQREMRLQVLDMHRALLARVNELAEHLGAGPMRAARPMPVLDDGMHPPHVDSVEPMPPATGRPRDEPWRG